jgi:hypothetical protein
VTEDQAQQVPLSAAIGEVRRELAKAIEEGRDSPVAFRAGPVELEFTVAFDRTVGGDAGVRVWVLSIGTRAEATRTETNRLKVTLTPVDRQGHDRLIGSIGSN